MKEFEEIFKFLRVIFPFVNLTLTKPGISSNLRNSKQNKRKFVISKPFFIKMTRITFGGMNYLKKNYEGLTPTYLCEFKYSYRELSPNNFLGLLL